MTDDSLDNKRNSPQDQDSGIVSYFISYARVDRKHAQKIQEGVEKSSQSVRVWIDERDIEPGGDVAPEIQKAIGMCSAMLFLVSKDSVTSSYCRTEIAVARNNHKPIIPLRLYSEVDLPARELPLQIQDAHYIDFWTDFEGGLKKLCADLARKRGKSLPSSMAVGPADVTTPASPGKTGPIMINASLLRVPADFVGRSQQYQEIEDFMSKEDSAVLWIFGRAGSGKTALACRVLDQVLRGAWVSPECEVPIHAVAYLNQKDHSESKWLNVFDEIRSSVPAVPRLYSQERHLASAVADVLSGLTDRCVALLIDHLDELIDPNTRSLTDPNVRDTLQAALSATTPRLKVIVTSQVLPLDLPTAQKVRNLNLKEGLPRLDAMQLLRTLDRDGTVGLRDAADTLLTELCRRAQDNPGAIKTLYAILDEDRSISPLDILRDETRLLPERVLKVLIAESYASLDDRSKIVMQILSVCKTPVTADAVAYVFQHSLSDINARLVLNQLVNLQLVKKTDDEYCLREADRWYVASQLSDHASSTIGDPKDVHLDRSTLYKRHADYIERTLSANDPTVGSGLCTVQLEQLHYYRFNEANYAAAFDVLERLEPQLLAEERSGELTERCEQLVGKLQDPTRARRLFDTLARNYHRRGELDRAAACYEGGLKCARGEGDLNGQCLYLGNLAICKQESGDLLRATLYCMAALELASQTGDSVWEAHIWTIISEVLVSLGQISAAMKASKRALKLARDNRWREIEVMGIVEVVALANLGQHHEAQGNIDKADDECNRAYEFAEKIQFQLGKATARRNLGILDLNQGKYKQASRYLKEAMQLADKAQSVQLQQTIRIELAAAQLLDSKLDDAEVTVNTAVAFDTPFFTPEAYCLRGVILRRQGRAGEAAESFHHALKQAEVILKRTPRYYRGLDVMGLSYSGLTLSEETDEYLDRAIGAYEAARLITNELGIVRRRLRLFDALAQADSGKKLTLVRTAIDPEQ